MGVSGVCGCFSTILGSSFIFCFTDWGGIGGYNAFKLFFYPLFSLTGMFFGVFPWCIPAVPVGMVVAFLVCVGLGGVCTGYKWVWYRVFGVFCFVLVFCWGLFLKSGNSGGFKGFNSCFFWCFFVNPTDHS